MWGFGGYIYVLTCKCVYFLRFTNDQAYPSLRRSQAMQVFDLGRNSLSICQHMANMLAIYSLLQKLCRNQIVLVDHDYASLAAITLHSSVDTSKHVLNRVSRRSRCFRDRQN
jgi:hypothetical protein